MQGDKGGWKAAHARREVSRVIASMTEPLGPSRAEGLHAQHSVCYESSLRAAKILSKITKLDTLDAYLPFAAGVLKQAETLRRRHPAVLRTQYTLKLRALNKKSFIAHHRGTGSGTNELGNQWGLGGNGAWTCWEPPASLQHEGQQIIDTKWQCRVWLPDC